MQSLSDLISIHPVVLTGDPFISQYLGKKQDQLSVFESDTDAFTAKAASNSAQYFP